MRENSFGMDSAENLKHLNCNTFLARKKYGYDCTGLCSYRPLSSSYLIVSKTSLSVKVNKVAILY